MRHVPDFREDHHVPASVRRTPKPVQVPPPETSGAWMVEPDHDSIVTYWRTLWRFKWAVLALVAVGGLSGLLVGLRQTPVYQARAALELQSLNQNYLDIREVEPTAVNYASETYMQTQLQVLSSSTLLDKTVNQLRKFEPPILTAPRRTPFAWAPAFLVSEPKTETREQALAYILGHLNVRGSGLTRVIEVMCDSPHPKLASKFANALMREYTDQSLQARWDSAQHTGEWLKQKLEELKEKLTIAENRLQEYSRSTGLMFTNEKGDMAEQGLSRVEEEYASARNDRMQKESRYQQALASSPDTVPEVLDSASFHEYSSKLTELRRQMVEARSSLKEEHPKVQRIQAQIAELTGATEKQRRDILSRIGNEYEIARRREAMIESARARQQEIVTDHAKKSLSYNLLKREVDGTRQMYDSMLQKMKEVRFAGAMPVTNVRVIDGARPPHSPYLPSIPLNTTLGMATGLSAGIGLAFVRQRLNRRLRIPGEVSQVLGIRELGAIPSFESDPTHSGRGRLATVRRVLSLNGRHEEGEEESRELAVLHHRRSYTAEAYRTALIAILVTSDQRVFRTFVITSPSPQEGKTSAVCNLGVALAEVNKRVLLVDCDFRRPRLHKVFGLPNREGVSDLLMRPSLSEAGLESLAIPAGIPGLFVVPSGARSADATNLIYSTRMSQLFRHCRREFDAVLIDTPPSLHIRDARLLGRLSDAVVLVLRAGQTERTAAAAAVHQFKEDGTLVFGAILNDWNPGEAGAPYGNSYLKNYTQQYGK